MPQFRVEALERFTVVTVYFVEADTPAEAERMAISGEISYHKSDPTGDGDEWLDTISIEEVD